MGMAFYLVALGVGFLVFSNASLSGKKSLKNLGRIIGVFIMVMALMGTMCKGVKMMKYAVLGGSCSYSKSNCSHCSGESGYKKSCCSKHGGLEKGKQCPFSKKTAEA